jgi:superfamily I DNA/RNA helicase
MLARRQLENLDQLANDIRSSRCQAEQNYRCPAESCAAPTPDRENPHAHLKQLWSQHGDGENVRVWAARPTSTRPSARAEIHYLAGQGNPPGRVRHCFAATISQGRWKALQLLRIPYHLTGGTAFPERAEVKDAPPAAVIIPMTTRPSARSFRPSAKSAAPRSLLADTQQAGYFAVARGRGNQPAQSRHARRG